ncbi:MAG: ATP-binding protein, partial [Anaerolineaceae bacterium]|nr:ATP-binding protein [Anaerolineaceae bacterium]
LTTPPGNLIYHLTLIFSIAVTLQNVLASSHANKEIKPTRMLVGVILILTGQLGMFFISGFTWQGIANPHLYIPPVDRLITTLTLIWIIWLWAFQKPMRPADLIMTLLSLAVVVLFIFTMTAWTVQEPTASFNITWLDWSWNILSIFIIISGILLFLMQRPQGWRLALIFLMISLIGFAAHLLWGTTAGDYSPAVRLALICAFPLLPGMTRHLQSKFTTNAMSEIDKEVDAKTQYVIIQQNTLINWLQLAIHSEPEKIRESMMRAVAIDLGSDLCYLIRKPDAENKITILGGYDRVRNEELSGAILDQSSTPVLEKALKQRQAQIMNLENTSDVELKALIKSLGLDNITGSFLLLPLATFEMVWGGFLLISPFTPREWNQSDEKYLKHSGSYLVQILQRIEQQISEQKKDKILDHLDHPSIEHLNNLEAENRKLKLELESFLSGNKNLNNLINLQNESEKLIAKLKEEKEQIEVQMKSSDEELFRLKSALDIASEELKSTGSRTPSASSLFKQSDETAFTTMHDIYETVEASNDYVEILLSDSQYKLDGLQRSFLGRIKVMNKKLYSHFDDLIQPQVLDELRLLPVDIGTIVDEVVDETSMQLLEKNITLQMNITDRLPQIHAGSDHLSQILTLLLMNAGKVTPPEGTVSLHIQMDGTDPERNRLLLLVSDTGEGINPEDLSRIYEIREETDKIRGISDSGYGLAVVKTIAEMHGGEIWVESKPGETIYNVIYPISS